MNKTTAARHFAKAGLVLACVEFAVLVLIRLIPDPFLRLLGGMEVTNRAVLMHPLHFVPGLLFLGLFIVLYRMLCKDLDGQPQNATLILIAVMILFGGGFSLFSWLYTMFESRLLILRYGAHELAENQVLKSCGSVIGILTVASRPLLTVAAALNWARTKSDE